MGNVRATGKVHRLKRRLVQQAVQENLDLIQGRRGVDSIRRRHRRHLLRRLALVLLLPAAALASAYALHGADPAETLARARGWMAEPAALSARATGEADRVQVPPPPEPIPVPLAPEPSSAEVLAALEALPAAIDHAVFPLAVRRVVVDPGHGGPSLGTRTSSGLIEKEITLDIAQRLSRILAEDGFEVLMTREGDQEVDLQARARLANEQTADIFVSIHVNWIDDGGTRGVETYYLGTTEDPYLNQLAAAENLDSGYSMGDLRRLLDRIVTGVRVGKSQQLAAEVQGALFRSLRKVNPQLRDRGIKSAPFLVLVETEMPAILAEVSCLSNEREAELLGKSLYRQFIAEALASGIGAYARADGPVAGTALQKGSG